MTDLALAIIMVAALCSTSAAGTIRLEAESGELVGTSVSTARDGYSGAGYVTGFDADADKVVLHADAPAGLYQLRIRYCTPHGPKGYGLTVNGESSAGMFPDSGAEFALHSAGKVELRAGANTIAIEKGWGWYEIDSIELAPAAPAPRPRKPPKTLVDPHATPAARAVMSYLVDRYGERTLSGQYDVAESDYIRTATGETPAILGADLIDHSPSRVERGADPKDLAERLIARARAGQLITLCWHWNAPKDLVDKEYQNERGETVRALWWAGFYTYATTFDVQHALDHPDSEDYRLLLRDIDAIAAPLKQLAAADVPVLWRPLHEAEGAWFWWGAKGSEPFVKLWRLLFGRLTRHHGLHNLIWVHTGTDPEWYPGDAYVDLVGVDAYPPDPRDPLSSTWEELIARFDGSKLLAVTEFGGVPDVEKMHRYGARWAFFVSWTGRAGPKKMTENELARIYQSALVINRDDLPASLRPRAATAD
jgi:mannan endo-1,4-beta-mannosidase